jgi:hypothetical protein
VSTRRLELAPGPSVGPVVLDIGGRFGAAVVRTPEEFDGAEIEIRRQGERWDGTHAAVRARPGCGRQVFAAVFGHVEEGSYELRFRVAPAESASVHRVQVTGGEVADTWWPPGAATSPASLIAQV